MKKWIPVIILACAQFVMVLDSTVMNVSISTVVEDLDTTVTAMQAAITFYTLTMAAMMLLGAKMGDIWGRKKAFIIGSIIYATGSLITALSPNIQSLFLGWSVVEGLGAVLVIPAIAALVASNYKGRDRVTAFAIIGGISGAAMAAGPLIGGFMTTYLSWRYVFVAEVIIMAGVLLTTKLITDTSKPQKIKIDIPSVLLSSMGLVFVVFGMLQSKTWGWITPLGAPVINGHEITPLGISLVAYLILLGVILLRVFYTRQQKLVEQNRLPLVQVSMLSIKPLRSGLSVLLAQYAIIAGLFFMIPVYLQMTLGYDALKTGMKIFPLSLGLIAFSVVGTKLSSKWSPRKIIRVGQVILIASSVLLLASVSLELKNVLFAIGMFTAGAALGLLSSQIGNVTMSSVSKEQTSEVGGLQGVFQNLGSSLGTALIGSVLVASLTTSFVAGVNNSDLPPTVKTAIEEQTQAGVAIVPAASVDDIAQDAGLSKDQGSELTQIYSDSQIESLRTAFYALIVIATISLLFSRNIPDKIAAR